MPTTLLAGRPDFSFSTQTIASSGLVMQMTKAFGQLVLMPSATVAMTPAFLPMRSSRDMPGVRGKPAVMITTSASLIAA